METDSSTSFHELFPRARHGDEQALGGLLEEHRAYLRLLALRALDGALAARLDASDVVQQTFLSAIRNFPAFTGNQAGEFLAWLVQIHQRNLLDAVRAHRHSQKRSVGSEQPLTEAAAVDDSQASRPSQRLLAGERAVHLAKSLEKLPSDQREAVRLRHLEGLSLAELAVRLDRSERAAAALLHRGIAHLRSRLREEE